MSNIISWEIHLCANGEACDICGEIEHGFMPYICNAHTHGMNKFNHKDFQVVIDLPQKEIGRTLNTLGCMVRDGRRFHAGEYVKGIYLDCDVRLEEFEETDRTVLRVVIPDKNNRFPESDSCAYPYSAQKMQTRYLYSNGGVMS